MESWESSQDFSREVSWDLLGHLSGCLGDRERSPTLQGLKIDGDSLGALQGVCKHWRCPNAGNRPPRILLLAQDPGEFVRGLVLGNALAQRSPLRLFLGNPDCSIAERRQAIEQIQPHQIWSDRHNPWHGGGIGKGIGEDMDNHPVNGGKFLKADQSYVGIGTGGSSGKIRFAMHTWGSLRNAVDGFCNYFDDELDGGRAHSFCTLPLFHVSGLMQLLRCIWSGGVFQWGRLPKSPVQDFSAQGFLAQDFPIPDFPKPCWQPEENASPSGFISLVPTQLARLLDNSQAIPWLGKFRVILLGGAPPWADLLERSRKMQLPIAPTYGMTETAAQVATLKPADFLAGKTGVGYPLPHVSLEIAHETPSIVVRGGSLAAGYWQGEAIAPALTTGDLGRFNGGYLSILGRRDDVIITGGENVMPQEVEAAILATGVAADVCVVGVPHREWGQQVVAVWVPQPQRRNSTPTLPPKVTPTSSQWQYLLGSRLSRYKHPKLWCQVAQIPRNSRGKVNRSEIAAQFLSQGQEGQ
ncbi:MAG: AMP-binding protein [Cyanophyceae cyanobacterium]